ncbi:MAG: hypothetical protein M3R62_11010, partial [Acidobacteriota bacterium]|nr:hypothetical protein [Acidobacteriota bacterium]
SEGELRKFAGRLARSASEAGQLARAGPAPAGASGVTAILNNHFRGQAVANAIELQHLLTGEVVTAPASLSETYPSLARITQPAPPEHGPSQGSLFAGPRSGKGP